MIPRDTDTLILGLGNDIIADDAVGIRAVRALAEQVGPDVTVVETSLHGIALLDELLGYQRVILLDAIQTGTRPPGTIVRLDPTDFQAVYAPSPHYAGLPEMLDLARQLDLPFPAQVDILAVEIADSWTIGGPMTPAVKAAIPQLRRRVLDLLSRDAGGAAPEAPATARVPVGMLVADGI